MRNVQDFVTTMRQREHELGDLFDVEEGSFLQVEFCRRFDDAAGRLLLCKFAHFRVFKPRDKPFEYWALPEDLKFTSDGETFKPQEGDSLRVVNSGAFDPEWELHRDDQGNQLIKFFEPDIF